MANIASAKKRARQAAKRRLHNMSQRSLLRGQIKKVINAIQKGEKDLADKAFLEAVPVINKMVQRGLIHKNKAARHMRKMNAQIRALGSR